MEYYFLGSILFGVYYNDSELFKKTQTFKLGVITTLIS